jgi:hypothetical protein
VGRAGSWAGPGRGRGSESWAGVLARGRSRGRAGAAAGSGLGRGGFGRFAVVTRAATSWRTRVPLFLPGGTKRDNSLQAKSSPAGNASNYRILYIHGVGTHDSPPVLSRPAATQARPPPRAGRHPGPATSPGPATPGGRPATSPDPATTEGRPPPDPPPPPAPDPTPPQRLGRRATHRPGKAVLDGSIAKSYLDLCRPSLPAASNALGTPSFRGRLPFRAGSLRRQTTRANPTPPATRLPPATTTPPGNPTPPATRLPPAALGRSVGRRGSGHREEGGDHGRERARAPGERELDGRGSLCKRPVDDPRAHQQ